GERGRRLLADGGKDQPAALVDVSPSARASPAPPRANVPPDTGAGSGGTNPPRDGRVPPLLAAGGARSFRETPAAAGPPVPAAAPRQLWLPVTGGAIRGTRRARLVRAAPGTRGGRHRQALLRREDLRDASDVHAAGAGPPAGGQASGLRPVGGETALV